MTKDVEVINHCADTCQATLGYCLEHGGRHAEANHVITMMDCIDSCRLSAAYILRGSELVAQACALCAAVCQHCADHCLTFPGDAAMKRCAEACERCADHCRGMAVAPGQMS